MIWINQVMHDPGSVESTLPAHQMRWHGISVDDVALTFGGKQQISGPDFTIPLMFDGKRLFFHHSKSLMKLIGEHSVSRSLVLVIFTDRLSTQRKGQSIISSREATICPM
jgi:hypothetical protein